MRHVAWLACLAFVCAAATVQAQPAQEPDELAPHLAVLGSDSKEVRCNAIKEIGAHGLGARNAVGKLGWHVREDPDDKVANEAARALAQVGRAAVPELVRATQHPKVAVRNRALWALGLMGPVAKDAVDALTTALKDPQPDLRALAALALGDMGPDARPAIPALCQALRDRNPNARTQAAIALRNLGKDALPPVRELLREDDADARLGGLQAAALIGPDAVPLAAEIAMLLQDDAPAIRKAAADALGSIGPDGKDTIPALTTAMRDKNGDVQLHAFQAILRIGSADVPGLLETMRKLNGEAHWAFPYILRQFGPRAKDAVKPMIAQLESPDDGMRLSAALALAQIGKDANEAAAPLLRMLNKDQNPMVRHAAGVALVRVMTDPPADFARKLKAAADQIDNNIQQLQALLPPPPQQPWTAADRPRLFDHHLQHNYYRLVQVHIMKSTYVMSLAVWDNAPNSPPRPAAAPCRLGEEALPMHSLASRAQDHAMVPALIRGMHLVAYHDLGFC